MVLLPKVFLLLMMVFLLQSVFSFHLVHSTNQKSFLFDGSTTIPIVAPFFTDIDISDGVGQINYETHTRSTSEYAISQVDSVINEQADTNFNGRWMLVATWDRVPPLGDNSIVSNVCL
jgi:hypothetical protein